MTHRPSGPRSASGGMSVGPLNQVKLPTSPRPGAPAILHGVAGLESIGGNIGSRRRQSVAWAACGRRAGAAASTNAAPLASTLGRAGCGRQSPGRSGFGGKTRPRPRRPAARLRPLAYWPRGAWPIPQWQLPALPPAPPPATVSHGKPVGGAAVPASRVSWGGALENNNNK